MEKTVTLDLALNMPALEQGKEDPEFCQETELVLQTDYVTRGC